MRFDIPGGATYRGTSLSEEVVTTGDNAVEVEAPDVEPEAKGA